MKLLLIGFSAQSAGVLGMLVSRNYPEHEVMALDRCFGDGLRLCLPTLSPVHQDAEAVIINLDGVGMTTFSQDHAKALQDFVGKRALLLIARGNLDVWKNANILPAGMVLSLNAPYNKDTMTEVLEQLFIIVSTIPARMGEFAQTTAAVNSLDSSKNTDEPSSSNSTPIAKKSAIDAPKTPNIYTASDHFLHQLLEKYFVVKHNILLHELLNVILEDQPLKLTAGNQTLYIDKSQNLALAADVDELLAYCATINNFELSSNVISLRTIDQYSLKEMIIYATSNGYKKYALNTLLWQMYSKILPDEIDTHEHHLSLKIRYMPNFSHMQDIPEYVRAVISSCLVTPKTIAELKQNFEGDSAINEQVLNRLLLLSILSGSADLDVLKASFDSYNHANDSTSLSDHKVEGNDGVKKAQKTGFLKRFLNKLKF